jgi:hypothetical protein
MQPKNKKSITQTAMDFILKLLKRLFNGRFLCYYFSFVVQAAFAHMGTVAYVRFAGGAVGAQGSRGGFIVRTALGAALLRVSAFGIWHNV